MSDLFNMQDEFYARMKADYESGLIGNPILKPYFDWKFYHAPLNTLDKRILFNMREAVSRDMEILDEKYPDAYRSLTLSPTADDIWKPYKCYGEDKYLYSYLDGIESEISRLMVIV